MGWGILKKPRSDWRERRRVDGVIEWPDSDKRFEPLQLGASKTPPPLPGQQSRRGYEIKRTFAGPSPGEAQAREEEVLRIIADAMKDPKAGD